ncbi:RagB/SusD family nutrient uptake outer membrane protein [Dysgonomonas sp. 25]|nr:RagB/SusD family nutrient uptake outer membrane protein [Dysgonomonas sp. 25]
MRKTVIGITLACTMLASSGCNEFLNDTMPTDKVSDKVLWSKPEYAKLALNNCYHYIRIYGVYDNDGTGQSRIGLTEGATETLKYGSLTRMPHMSFANELAFGQAAADYTTAESFLGGWGSYYNRIMAVNRTYADFKKYASFDQATQDLIEAEIRYFRGYLYFELIKRFKTVVLRDENLDAVGPNAPLMTEAEGWEFVYQDLLFAAQTLPVDRTGEDAGRLNKAAAYGMLSRAMLYAERWQDARDAAKEVIDLNKYDLNPVFKDAFKSKNIESILEFNYQLAGPNHLFDDIFAPKGDAGVVRGGMGVPTQEMVESFELATGGFANWTPWHATSGTTVDPPYASLEPRFHATILYNGATWKGRTIEPFIGGRDGWCSYKDDPDPQGRTTTGYYLRKMLDEGHDLSVNYYSTQPYIAIRYAEILLNYAEACYHNNQGTDISEANWAVKEIRDRVSLPYTNKTGTALMDAIRQERKVELAYEGHLYWDMRRWRLAHTAYSNMRVHGLKIENVSAGVFRYSYVDCDKQDRQFPEKLYRIPLPLGELQNNNMVEQFPEWR